MGAKVEQEYGVVECCKRQAVKTAPYAYQMKTNPSTYKVGGRVVETRGSNVSGGNMNGGGKRRPFKALNSKID